MRCFADARVACVLQLGDLIDGQAKDRDAWATMQALVADLDAAGAPVFHCVGNHELYCLPKDVALAVTRQSAWRIARTVPGHASWKVVVLDAYEVSTLDPASAPAAEAVLAARNPNDWRSVKADWLTGLNGTDRRFVPFNGALGSVQLEWLRRELDAPGTNVIICSHVSICPGSASDECLVWDYEEALEVIESCAASVVAVLSGHDHAGGYAERAGIPYVTIQRFASRCRAASAQSTVAAPCWPPIWATATHTRCCMCTRTAWSWWALAACRRGGSL